VLYWTVPCSSQPKQSMAGVNLVNYTLSVVPTVACNSQA
jgi:hypothetical protein